MPLTREQARQTILGGGSVLHKGRLLTKIEHLQFFEGTDEEKQSELQKLKARVAELEGASKPAEQPAELPPTAFPDEFPARAKFENLGKSFDEVKAMSREDLIALEGIGEKTADDVLAYGK